jgi:hypothetical protein
MRELGSARRNLMIYIQIPEEHDAAGFLALAKSGIPVSCLPENSYGVSVEHLNLLHSKHIPFKRLENGKIPIPQPSQPHDEEI